MSYAKLHEVQTQLAQAGGTQLGTLLWWQLNGNRIEHDAFVDLAAKQGLDAKYVPSEVKPTAAFRRACRHIATKLPKGLMLRPIDETSDEIIVGLVNEQPDAARRDLDYNVASRIVFNKGTSQITADVEHPAVWQLHELYRHHQALTTEDIRNMLSTFLHEAGVNLRDAGGVYFVPVAFQRTLDGLCKVVEAVGKGNRCFTLPIVDAPQAKATLREVAKRSLDDEIRQLEDELGRFELDKVRQSTLVRKLDGFEELRSRVGLFSRVLSFKADSLTTKIDSVQALLRRQLAGAVSPCLTSASNDDASTPQPMVAAGVGF